MLSKPARKIGPNNRSITGKRPSQKTNRSQHFESALERDHLLLLEWDETVSDYEVQPVSIYYDDNGRSRKYTPDVAVYYHPELNREPLLVEIKYEAELVAKKDEYALRFKAAHEYADDFGFEFMVITEKMIRTDYLYNLKFLNGYRQAPLDTVLADTLLQQFSAGKALSPLELQDGEDSERNDKILYTLWQLLAKGGLTCDLQQKLTMNILLWTP